MARAWVSWSSGKDSTLALAVAREDPDLEVVGLLTTVNAAADRVAMHAVRRELLEAQAAALGLPLHVVELPWPCSNEDYERLMAGAVAAARGDGVTRMVFGDLYLADVRAYREHALAGSGIDAVFPLWGRDTAALAREMLDRGVRATLTCVDPRQLDPGFVGRAYDASLLAELPPEVDPCGENGEFHTFVGDGPGFAHPLAIRAGEVVEREGFVFADLVPE
ncbi:MAG TPA: hypothetical protein VFM09_00730 [Marmoricola sp.]|nr:hypothetical protein [Marmoricola sp.]